MIPLFGIVTSTILTVITNTGRGAGVTTREQIDAYFLRQREVRKSPPVSSGKKVSSEQYSAGGCDGIKDVKCGFHKENE